MDEDTFETIHRLEARIDGLRQAIFALIVQLTYENPELARPIGASLFGAFVEASERNAHAAMLEELRRLGNDLTGLVERRAENEAGSD